MYERPSPCELEELYIKEKLSARKIADIFDIQSEQTIYNWLNAYKIKIRNYSEMQQHELNHEFKENNMHGLVSWGKRVKERDNFTCQKCGSKRFINAHHIKNTRNFPELAFNIDNGITLCRSCHNKIEPAPQTVKKLKKNCIRCGNVFYVLKASYKKSKYCRKCQKWRKEENWKIWKAKKAIKAIEEMK
jgi:ribosomal protein S27AE